MTEHRSDKLGPEERFKEIVSYLNSVRARVKTRSPDGDDDEIIQTVIAKVARAHTNNPALFDTIDTIQAYLKTAVDHELFTANKRSTKRLKRELSVNTDRQILALSLQQLPDPSGDPLEQLIRREDLEQLGGAFRGLPRDCRKALELKYVEDMKTPEIAARMGIDPTTVTSRLKTSRARIRVVLEERDAAVVRDHARASKTLRDGPSGFDTLKSGDKS